MVPWWTFALHSNSPFINKIKGKKKVKLYHNNEKRLSRPANITTTSSIATTKDYHWKPKEKIKKKKKLVVAEIVFEIWNMKLVVKQITQFANKPKYPICFTNFPMRRRKPIAFASSVAADLTIFQSCGQRNPSIVTKTEEMRECSWIFEKKLVPILLLHYGQRNDHESEKKKKKKDGICLSYTERKAKAKAKRRQENGNKNMRLYIIRLCLLCVHI